MSSTDTSSGLAVPTDAPPDSSTSDDDDVNCGTGGGDTGSTGLRIASVFIVMIGSMMGALFPVLARRTRWLSPHVPKGVFEFAKYFGSGVIVSGPFFTVIAPGRL